MSSRSYSIVEPHPSVSSHAYMSTGRGGAGNVTKVPSTVTRGSDASGPASRLSQASLNQPRRSFISGRGGAGNHVREAPRIFSFDEELEHQMRQDKHVAPVYHVGRGGAGNLRTSTSSSDYAKRRTSDSNSASSASSAESGADVATRNIKKGWMKLTGLY